MILRLLRTRHACNHFARQRTTTAGHVCHPTHSYSPYFRTEPQFA